MQTSRTLPVIAFAWLLLGALLLPAQDDGKKKEAKARFEAIEARVDDLFNAGRYAQAKPLAEEALKVAQEALGPEDELTALGLSRLGMVLQAMGDLKGAQPLYERSLAICEKVLGPDHPGTSAALNNLASVLQVTGDLKGAQRLYERALAISEKVQGHDHPATAACLNNLAAVLQEMGDLKGARPLLERALAIDEKALGAGHPDTANDLENLGCVLQDMGDMQGARPLFERALAINEKSLGPDQPLVAHSLHDLGCLLQRMGDSKGARPLFERALAIRERALGPDHPDTAASLNDLANALQAMGDLNGARPLFERALAIREKSLGPDHPDTAQGLSNLANLLQAMGDLKGARPLYERALTIWEKSLGPDHSGTAVGLNNLATLLQAMGNLKGARLLLDRSLAIREKAFGPNHPDTAVSLNNLADLLRLMGDLKGARPLLERALAVYEKALGPDHTDTAKVLNNLALVLQGLGDLKGARPLYERALAIQEKALGPDHPVTALGLNNLASVLRDMGDLKEARPLYERALAIQEKTLGPDHPDTATGLNNLACVLQAMGDSKGARPLFERALAIQEKALGPDHPQTGLFLNNLAVLLDATGDTKGARALYEHAWSSTLGSLRALLPVLSSRERCAAVKEQSTRLARYLAWFADGPEKTYAAALAWKGAVLRADAATMRVPASAPAEARRVAADLADARRALASLASSPPAPKDGEPSVAERCDGARKKVEELERRLAEQLPDFAKRAFLEVDLPAVRQALPEGAALLDTLVSGGDLHAWIVRREGEVAYANLGKVEDFAPLAAGFREALERDDEKQWKEAGGALRRKLEKALGAALAGTKTLYVSPDGVLATIPWGLLPEGDGFLIERLSIVCVSGGGAGLVMAASTPRNAGAEGLLTVGGVDYEKAEGAQGKGARPGRQASALPATRVESDEVAKRFTERFPRASLRALTGAIATVARFERLAPSARFVHVATHGYFDTEHLAVALGSATRGFSALMTATPLQQTFEARRESVGGWNPLLLSGIVLAGANAGDGGGGSDGLLTAEEVQGLDLTGTELVVLSACETGRGELAAGEGVLGLSRALFVAGAKGFMLSLWAVPDADTRELMEGFYEGMWSRSQSAEDALRSTQRRMLLRDREAKSFRPSTWGAWLILR